jgi:glycosyltransferase involved in cell wall biosynthesis
MAAYALRSADAVTGDSKELEREVGRIATRAPWHRFVFGPSASLFKRERTPESHFVSSRRLTAEMRVERVIEAFLAARQAYPVLAATRLTICGEGPELGALRASMAHPMIDYRGFVSQRELEDLLLTARAFVSIPVTDGTSASLLEAMAAGTMPIVNAIPANLEWVTPAIGEVVPRDPSTAELASAMARALAREADSEAIRAAVADSTWEIQIASLLELYARLTPMR